jgi:hypothetical protein
MKYSLTIFNSIFDNKTHRRMTFESFDGLEELLYNLSAQPGYKPKKGEFKKGSPLISPAIFKNGETRKNINVLSWGGWAALDVDDYEGSFSSAVEAFQDVRHVCYSSASSTVEKPKFRIVFPLSDEVPADKIRHFWYALNKKYNSLGDPQTKDLSRMYYVPAQYPQSNHFIWSHKDAPLLDPDELMSQYEYVEKSTNLKLFDRLPDEMKKKIQEHRLKNLNNTTYSWNSYRDCPFINQNMVVEYKAIQNSGWYLKMYQIMVSIASNAMRRGYPITAREIVTLCKEIDLETGSWYSKRDMVTEASRAIEYSIKGL